MNTYARDTSVDSAKSRAEIERTLARYGAEGFMYGWDRDRAVVGFVSSGRQVKFILPLPDRNAKQFTHTPSKGLRRSAEQQEAAFEQGVRQRWRALALVIKAKLEAVEAGIVTFEQEFAMHMILPSGQTVGEWVIPQLQEVYAQNQMPALLPGSSS